MKIIKKTDKTMTFKLLPITKKQQTIINLLYHFRFLNRIQIQIILNHKDRKTINEWLSDLTKKGYIDRIYSNKTITDKIKPAIYYIAKGGVKYLKSSGDYDSKALHKLYYEKDRTQDFINRSILIADIYLKLSDETKDKASFTMSVPSIYPEHTFGELLTELSPHGFIEQKQNGKTEHYFIEILGDLPATRIRQRLKRYLSLYESNEWESGTGEEFPTLLVICPDEKTLIYAKRFLKRKFSEMDDELLASLTNINKIKEYGLSGDIWESIIRRRENEPV